MLAMLILGFTESALHAVFTLISGIMHASNLSFTPINDEGCEIDRSNDSSNAVSSLFGIELKDMNNAVCSHEVTIGTESFKKSYSIQKAEKTLEAMMKAIYHALFSYIVDQINETISFESNEVQNKDERKAGFIGVLDIFGFESFEKNSFEQLCINYCNEVLQQQFNLTTFLNDRKEFEEEGKLY